MGAEQVFKALADHHRRQLLDQLSIRDGQSLNELCAYLPMSRIGVMKHLRILEQAGLIATRKVGRERLHYLTPAPLRAVVDWAEQYRRHWDERMDRLDAYLRELQAQEQQAQSTQVQSTQVQSTQAQSTKEKDHDNQQF